MLKVVFFAALIGYARAWDLVWSDEFDYTGPPDPTKWGYNIGGSGWGNGELEYYTDRPENARVENGNLVIEARLENFGGNKYTSARLFSNESWTYGRFEARAKVPTGVGSWPAIWMLPTDWVFGWWPDSGEMDIMEHVGFDPNNVHGSLHCKNYNGMIGNDPTAVIYVDTATTDFNVYAAEWDEKEIRMYVNDKQYFSWDKLSDSYADWPFFERFHFMMNIAVGGTWGGQQGVDDSIFPIQLQIDYIRVYK